MLGEMLDQFDHLLKTFHLTFCQTSVETAGCARRSNVQKRANVDGDKIKMREGSYCGKLQQHCLTSHCVKERKRDDGREAKPDLGKKGKTSQDILQPSFRNCALKTVQATRKG